MGSAAPATGPGLKGEVLLIAFPGPHNEEWVTELKAAHPDLEVRWVTHSIASPPESFPPEIYADVTLLAGFWPIPAAAVPKLRYVQLFSAGADRWIDSDLYKNPKITFCTANGAHAPQIAEWVIGNWLMATHHFLPWAAAQKEAKGTRITNFASDSPGLRMGILGYGAIGRHAARLGQALGMEVYAHTRSEKATPESRKDDSYCVAGTGDPDGLIPTKWFHGSSKTAVNDFLSQDLDLLVLSLPLTKESHHILSAEQFEILSKKKTFVANIARGQHIDTDALLVALREGKIRGAALDVTDPEPLPEGHELFTAPNVFITPHISWQSAHLGDRLQKIVSTNLEKLGKGEALINLMNREHHY
ncbi:uncharacterized protein C8A04DRAFT_14655 [Dichotomopilus funicola]|uniref:D-isomer specific 2-hydroxyacid dehydrogenase NAD-binding domain-containing protein n=1 Tax=Dichotomopilus funicola TaxID=1934379 RepID=A0AAN6UWZ0_9PEZI|nr:hypothetical protein C8A04DRAFT_14655 [Dichotomopilus funicola]